MQLIGSVGKTPQNRPGVGVRRAKHAVDLRLRVRDVQKVPWCLRKSVDEFQEALRIAGIGVGTVFLGLSLLMVLLVALGKLFPGTGTQGSGEAAPDEAVPTEAPASGGQSGAAPEESLEEVAAVAAALAVEWDSEEPQGLWPGPTVPQVRPSPWRTVGRQRLLGSQGARRGPWRR